MSGFTEFNYMGRWQGLAHFDAETLRRGGHAEKKNLSFSLSLSAPISASQRLCVEKILPLLAAVQFG